MAYRLGDYIDDHCSHCKRIMDHAVVSMIGDDVVRVRCRTCNYEHKFRKGQSGRKPMSKEEAFQKVLSRLTPGQAPAPSPKPQKRSRK